MFLHLGHSVRSGPGDVASCCRSVPFDSTISQSQTETDETTSTSENRSVTTRTEASTHTHLTPMLALFPRQIHHFLLQPLLTSSLFHTRSRKHRKRVYKPQLPFPFLPQHSSSASLFTFSVSSPLPSTSSLNQLMRKFSSCMLLYSLIKPPSSVGTAHLSSCILFFGKPVCATTFEFFPQPLALFRGNSSILPSMFHPFVVLSGALRASSLRMIFNICSFVFRLCSAAVHQLLPQTALRIARTPPAPHQGIGSWVHSLHHVMPSQMRAFLPDSRLSVGTLP